MGVRLSLLEILREDKGLAVMYLKSRIVPWDRSTYPTELLKSFYVNVPDTMRDVAPVPNSMRFVFDRYGHFFAQHCGLYSDSSYLKQLLPLGGITIDKEQYDEEGRRRLREYGDNHFATLESAVLSYNRAGTTLVVVGRMPKFSLSCGSTKFEDDFYVYIECGEFMKPHIVSLIKGSNPLQENEPVFLCSDLALKQVEGMYGFVDKAQIMVPKSLLHID